VSDELERLRSELDIVDGELVELVGKRLATVESIRAAKRASGAHVFDRRREQQVRQNAEVRAVELGIDLKVIDAIMDALLSASHAAQQEHRSEDTSSADLKHVVIVGGDGKMGRLFGRLFTERGHRVGVVEKGDALDEALQADVVMVSVPMASAVEVTRQLAARVRPGALVCDINSLKRDVCEAMTACRGEAMGMHPMFGPTVASLRRQKVVTCDVKTGPLCGWLRAELGALGAELFTATPEEHDKMMAVVQVLTHFGIMTMGSALAKSAVPLEDTLRFMSPIYRLEVSMIGRLFAQKAELYQEIVMGNPEAQRFLSLFVASARDLEQVINDGDRDAFARRFHATRDYFAEFSNEALALSDRIIGTLIARA